MRLFINFEVTLVGICGITALCNTVQCATSYTVLSHLCMYDTKYIQSINEVIARHSTCCWVVSFGGDSHVYVQCVEKN